MKISVVGLGIKGCSQLTLEAVGCVAPIGAHCRVVSPGHGEPVEAEVVGFAEDRVFLMPAGDIHGLAPYARVVPSAGTSRVPLGDGVHILRVEFGRGLKAAHWGYELRNVNGADFGVNDTELRPLVLDRRIS